MMSKYNKFFVALVTALGVLSPLLPDGLTGQEIIAVVVAGFGALGVYAVPNGRSDDEDGE